ncbi:MAG: nucleotidyltransferase family protein, partial [Longimicrobiales bacterium]|nr:nucleotidyltransferase family protein [Longimicrobiales bacterium]
MSARRTPRRREHPAGHTHPAGRDAATAPERVLGVILAGGGSTRFGSPKAAARIAGRPMAGWVRRALEPHLDEVVIVTGDPSLAALLPIRSRPDALPGLGPLGGLFTALGWAREEGCAGA